MKRLIVLLMLVYASADAVTFAQSKPASDIKGLKGAVPKEMIISARELREHLMTDPYRPAYHFCIPEGNGRPGDPNGAFFHNGRYHLMYLYERAGIGFAWGHISSKDLLNWQHHPDAIGPGDGDEGCFSGGAFVDDDGSAVLSYWMLWGDKGIGLAKSTGPDFNTWIKSDANPVIKSTEWGITAMKDVAGKPFYVGSADPSNIWKNGDNYYMLTGSLLVLRKFGSRGTGLPANFQ
jgi:beta-fructofuranosidase